MPLYESAEATAERVGETERDWMFNMRNLTIFPNMQIGENASSQLRVIRPLAARKTEMRTWCLAPKGESANARRQRIRQYEDFFNPSGHGDARRHRRLRELPARVCEPGRAVAAGLLRAAWRRAAKAAMPIPR